MKGNFILDKNINRNEDEPNSFLIPNDNLEIPSKESQNFLKSKILNLRNNSPLNVANSPRFSEKSEIIEKKNDNFGFTPNFEGN